MNAQQYAALFKQWDKLIGPKGAAAQVSNGFLREATDLMQVRHVQSEGGINAIHRELDRKWQKLARLEPRLKPGGYRLVLRTVNPERAEVLWPGQAEPEG